jgi:hypothetical protein
VRGDNPATVNDRAVDGGRAMNVFSHGNGVVREGGGALAPRYVVAAQLDPVHVRS